MRYLLAIFFLFTLDAHAQIFSNAELRCFGRVDNKSYEPLPQLIKEYRGLRKCRGAQRKCLVERARKSKTTLQVFYVSDCSKASVNFGNLGWGRQNVAVLCSPSQIQAALWIDQGMENHEVADADTALVDFLLREQARIADEAKCIRKSKWCAKNRESGGFCYRSFNEVQKIL